MIDGCGSGVLNIFLSGSCTMSDLVGKCAEETENHDEFVSRVAHLFNDLKKNGVITGMEKGKIQKCAAKADIP